MNPIAITGDLSANLVFAALASSLIPALVLKLIMAFFFQHNIGFIKLFAALLASVFIAFGIAYAMGLQSQAALRALPQNATLIITGATMLLQAVILYLVATDNIGQRIPLWHWFIGVILQSVFFFAFAFLWRLAISL